MCEQCNQFFGPPNVRVASRNEPVLAKLSFHTAEHHLKRPRLEVNTSHRLYFHTIQPSLTKQPEVYQQPPPNSRKNVLANHWQRGGGGGGGSFEG